MVVGGDFNVYLRPRLRRERRYQEDERLGVLELFGECSGLKVNDEKTEILALGSNFLQKTNFPKHNVCEVIKILGIYFCYDERQRDNLNFRQTLKSIKKSVKIRKWRGLPFWELEYK